ncbi:MAG: hypothetical protein ACI9H6_000582 [Patiriisocius sp.]|jgi:hypothetical protein
MIDKKSIVKMAKHVFRKGNGYPDRRLIHAKRDWAIGLFIFALVVIAGGAIAGDTFALYTNVALTEGDPGERIPSYNQRAADVALGLYRQRVERHEELQGVVNVVVEEEIPTEVEELLTEEGVVEDDSKERTAGDQEEGVIESS